MSSGSDAVSCRAVVLLCAALSLTIGVPAVRAAPTEIRAALQSVPTHHALHRETLGAWTVVVSAPTGGAGLQGAVLDALSTTGQRVRIPLDTSPTARKARAIDSLRLHAGSNRLLVLTDQAHDSPGLLVVDLPGGQVVTALIGRHMRVSPDAGFVAFEEYFVRLDTPWPWNETVYAVLDVTQSAAAMLRPCPYDDDRCRGVPIYLPSRANVCAAYRDLSGRASCLHPGREPQHERRSPFVWLDTRTVAFVSVDHAREEALLVTAAFDTTGAPAVRRHACDTVPDRRGVRCPPTRAAWMVDTIRRDDDDGQLWIHFRDRIPDVPGGWLGFTPATSEP